MGRLRSSSEDCKKPNVALEHSAETASASISNMKMLAAHSGSDGNDDPSGISRSVLPASEVHQENEVEVINSNKFELQIRLLGQPRQSAAADDMCYWAVMSFLQSYVQDHEWGNPTVEEGEDDDDMDGDAESAESTPLRIKNLTDSVTSTTSCFMNVVVIEANAQNEVALKEYCVWADEMLTAGESQYMVLLNQSSQMEDAWPAQGIETRVRNAVFRHFAMTRVDFDFKREQLWTEKWDSVDHVPLVPGPLDDDADAAFMSLAWEQLDHLSLQISIWFPPPFLHLPDGQNDDVIQNEEERKANAHKIFGHFEALFRDTPWETRFDQPATSSRIRTRSTSKASSAAITVSQLVEAYIKKAEQRVSRGLPVFPDGYASFRVSTQITGRPVSRDLPRATALRYWGIYSGGSDRGQVILVEAKQENKTAFKEYAEFLEEYPREDNDWDAWVLHDGDNDEDRWYANEAESAARREGLKLYLQNRQFDYPFDQMVDTNLRRGRKQGEAQEASRSTVSGASSWTRERLEKEIDAGNVEVLPLDRMSVHVHFDIVYCHGYLLPLRAATGDGGMEELDDDDVFDSFYDMISDFASRMQTYPIHTGST
eukprot:ANDGO_06858.mRNA.1 hypothetical protein